ncbi:MAG: hypothetical protein ACK55Z_22965 [bacterium]
MRLPFPQAPMVRIAKLYSAWLLRRPTAHFMGARFRSSRSKC